jgi:hypothetical protein
MIRLLLWLLDKLGWSRYDLNGDGRVDAVDVQLVINAVLGL